MEVSARIGKELVVKDYLDAGVGGAFTTMHHLSAQGSLEFEIKIVKDRMNFAIQCLCSSYFQYFNRHFLKSRDNIYVVYIIG